MKNKDVNISIIRIRLIQKKIERLKKKSIRKKRLRNIQNNSQKRSFSEQRPQRNTKYLPYRKVKISARSDFSLLDFPENVLSFVKDIDNAILKNK